MPGLSVSLGPLRLRNPVMTASGTCGYGDEMEGLLDIQRLGAVVTKGITLQPRPGNPQPRLAETPCGLLNSIGLENIGLERLVGEKAPLWARWQTPVIVNIAGEKVAEYAALARGLDGVEGVAGLEVNISCPNLERGGVEFGTHPELAAEVTRAVRKNTRLPVLVKLSPEARDIVAVARAVVEAGADALTVANTIRGMVIDVKKRRPGLGAVSGGLSGPAIRPIALYLVYQVAGAVEAPVIACGGIMSAQDALEFLMAGAGAVQVGTATFLNPGAALEVLDGVEGFLKREGMTDIEQLIGLARKGEG
ncbi:MAG: dihydroorotate dehydrogenase [Chloroflexota bacterium]